MSDDDLLGSCSLCGSALSYDVELEHLRRENARLRKALEFYADKKNYHTDFYGYSCPVWGEGGDKAREALK